jgi:Rrf2 family iron-sulfur cluster assembly transcriptional regulator
MKLPRTSHTALLLASVLAGRYGKERTSLAYISAKHGISVLFLKKLARALRQAGLVISREGMGGGYTLSQSPAKISVWDIVEAVDTIDRKDNNPVNISCPINTYCLPQNIQKTIDDALRKNLSSVSLKDLI